MHREMFLKGSLLVALILLVGMTEISKSARPPGLIAFHEAEILIYLLPQAIEIRSQGMDIGWERETGSEWNQTDYYFFWVYNAKRAEAGSVTVGHFAVNKHTGEVWELMLQEIVKTPELQGVQRILRRAHNIDEETLKQYQFRNLSAK